MSPGFEVQDIIVGFGKTRTRLLWEAGQLVRGTRARGVMSPVCAQPPSPGGARFSNTHKGAVQAN